jgi:hypothetical protein
VGEGDGEAVGVGVDAAPPPHAAISNAKIRAEIISERTT